MKPPKTICLLLALGLVGTAHAFEQGSTADGVAYATGGVSNEDRVAMQAQRERFNLWVVTAARKTGAYLSDARVTIRDARLQVVFDAPLSGPWLYIALPLGRYTVDAGISGQAQQRVTTIHPGDRHEAVFHFDIEPDAEVTK